MSGNKTDFEFEHGGTPLIGALHRWTAIMPPMKYLFVPVLLLTLCFTGCSISQKPVGGGYYLRTTHYFSWEPPGVFESLYFRGPQGARSRVWKNFTGPILVEGSTALFVGTTQPGEYELFAVKDGGARLEVGKPILAFEAERESADVSAFLEQHQILTWHLNRLTNGFGLEYAQRHGTDPHRRDLSLTWPELSTIMHRVESEGRPQKDRSGLSYLQIDFSHKR